MLEKITDKIKKLPLESTYNTKFAKALYLLQTPTLLTDKLFPENVSSLSNIR